MERGRFAWKERSSRQLFFDHLVDVAPEPALVGLGGGDDRVADALEVFGGVAVLGGVAAADVAALEAGAEMDPGVAEGYALLADVDRGGDVFGVEKMLAEHRHRGFPRWRQVENGACWWQFECYQTGCWRDRCGLRAGAVGRVQDADN